MTQQIKSPGVAGQGFMDGCGDGAFPQDDHEAFSQNCQENSDAVVKSDAEMAEATRLQRLARGCAHE